MLRRSYEDIIDFVGGWLRGDDVTADDFFVSLGLEDETDHPDRYERRDGEWYIKDKEL